MLKVGFARVDVTPPLGLFVAGYFAPRYSTMVLDPIEINTLALSDGEETALIVSVDMMCITARYANELRDIISKRTGVPESSIMISCCHQHSSVSLGSEVEKTERNYNNTTKDVAYMDVLRRKFGDVAVMACNDLKEATLFVGERETDEKISFIRRYYMKDGSIETNPHGRYTEVLRPYCEADNTVRLLRFKREDRDIALVNFSTHADVIHVQGTSADWPGSARRYVEKELGVACMVTVGAQGDSNHADFTIPEYKDGYEHSKHMGRVIADTVVKMWDDGSKTDVDRLNASIEIVYNRTRTDGEDKHEEMVAFLEDFHKNPSFDGSKITQLGEATRIVDLRGDAPLYQKLRVSVINLGKVGFVGFSGEMFTEYAYSLRERLKDRFLVFSCITNGYEGYFPTKKAFEEGGYESRSCPFSDTLEEDLLNMAEKLLKRK